MIKINLKTKRGYRLQNISNESFINYRKTKYGYSKKSEKEIKIIHEKIIEQRAIKRYKTKLIQIKEYQKLKRIAKKRFKKIKKEKRLKKIKKEPVVEKELIKYYNWSCECEVSDIIFKHIFGVSDLIGSDEEYVIRKHSRYYPLHKLLNIEMFDMSGENQKELHEELKERKKYITKTEGRYFYD
ncbi:MAG: hypothetical protein Q7T55_23105 [Solirubrobacteraceae bacterium]|nr:hypothetical protein [Solirubrobacteraceae bacterium]